QQRREWQVELLRRESQHTQHAFAGIGGHRRSLEDVDRAGRIAQHHVGEGAADIDADAPGCGEERRSVVHVCARELSPGDAGLAYRNFSLISMVERCPMASKWVVIQRSATSRPISFSCSRKSIRTLSLLETPSPRICLSASIQWTLTRLYWFESSLPWSIRSVTKEIARISRINDELKLISFSRFMISEAVVGTRSAPRGLICTITTSGDCVP